MTSTKQGSPHGQFQMHGLEIQHQRDALTKQELHQLSLSQIQGLVHHEGLYNRYVQ